jgi:hypothetical protein
LLPLLSFGCESSKRSKPNTGRPSLEECERIAISISKVLGKTEERVDFFDNCKQADNAEKWKIFRCYGDATSLVDFDICREKLRSTKGYREDPKVASQEAVHRTKELFDKAAAFYRKNLHCANYPESAKHATTQLIPPASIKCASGPGGNCVPTDSPKLDYEYSKSMWNDPIFSTIGFKIDVPHRFHYQVVAENYTESPDLNYYPCSFTAQAFADLDDDGIFSTFERAGAADDIGVNDAAGWYVEKSSE